MKLVVLVVTMMPLPQWGWKSAESRYTDFHATLHSVLLSEMVLILVIKYSASAFAFTDHLLC